jgi:DNA polymerase elongation subunit (family B)
MLFQILDWAEHNDRIIDTNDNDDEIELNKYSIRVYGRDLNNKSVALIIEDFKPYFYVKIPYEWKDNKVRSLIVELKNLIDKKSRDELFKYEIVYGKDFYGFTNEEENKYVKFYFNNIKAFYDYDRLITEKDKYKFYDGSLQIYESNIKPLLRFIHEKDLLSCGWIKVEKYNKSTISNCAICIKSNWDNITFYESKEIQKFITASFDIECTSPTGNFPEGNHPEEYITNISTVFQRLGESEPFLKHTITLKGCNKNYSGLEDVEIESYKTEKKLLLAWRDLIIRIDPDIITGHNINKFDFKYIKNRCVVNNMLIEFQQLGRIKNEKTKFIEKALGAKTLGKDNLIYYFEIEGRVIIDLLTYSQKELSLDNYKLDNLASTYIKEKLYKCLFEKENETIIITDSVYGLSLEQYITVVFFDGLTENKHDEKYKILNIGDITIDDKKYKKIVVSGIIPKDILEYKKKWWCLAKDDVSLKQLFTCLDGTDDDRAFIAKYCVMDCILVLKLLDKLKVINNNIAMANVCNVPLSYLFFRGQSIKILSLVSKTCRKNGFLIKKVKKYDENSNDEIGYEGALVIDPKTGIHMLPIIVLDFASLYPNSMICFNICHSCIVLDEKYLNNENYIYREVKYMEKNGDEEIEKTNIYAEKKNGEKGILPKILKELLDKRAETNKLKKNAETPFLYGIYDALQLAYKCTANSLYGQLGAKTSAIYLKDLAASTTAVGRQMLGYSKNFIENDYKNIINKYIKTYDKFKKYAFEYFDKFPDRRFIDKNYNNKDEYIKYLYDKLKTILKDKYKIDPNIIYGDSVSKDTPILLKLNDKIYIKTIETIGKSFKNYPQFKSDDDTLKNKEMDDEIPYQVWSSNGWTNIKKVIRHKTKKRMYSVLTHTGFVSITEDHSLLTDKLEEIKPSECDINTKLYHSYPTIINYENSNVSYDKAYIYGFFFGDGSCGKYNTKHGIKYSWALNNADIILNNNLLIKLQNIYPDDNFKILDTMKSSNVYKIVPSCGNIKKFVDEYRDIFYDIDKLKIIPSIIINGSIEDKKAFLEGYYAADGCRKDTIKYNCHRFDVKGQISATNMYYLIKSIGYDASINTRLDKKNIYRITYSTNNFRKNEKQIKKIFDLGYVDDYVYDLETDTGNFQAGIGELIVKNTDSVFFNPNIYDIDTNNIQTDKLMTAIQLGQLAGEMICKTLPEPEKQVYEKTLYPLILIAKKKYVGNLYEDNDTDFYQKSMGIVLKRRDNAKIVKITVGGIVDCILNKRNNQLALDYTKDILKKILKGEYKIDKFIISKTLKSDYKNRNGIAHAVLADRIKERDPGNAPNINDRIQYVYVITKNKTKLQGDKIEDPKYVIENNLEIDYLHYITNQIKNPSMQFLELIANNANKIFENLIIKEINRRKRRTNILEYIDDNDDNNFKESDEDKNNNFTIDNINFPKSNENIKKPKQNKKIELPKSNTIGFVYTV